MMAYAHQHPRSLITVWTEACCIGSKANSHIKLDGLGHAEDVRLMSPQSSSHSPALPSRSILRLFLKIQDEGLRFRVTSGSHSSHTNSYGARVWNRSVGQASEHLRRGQSGICHAQWRVSVLENLENMFLIRLLFSTKGGAGGTVTTVSTLPEFTAAVSEKNTAPVIVVVKGIITGNEKVRIGSNKSIIGLPGSGE